MSNEKYLKHIPNAITIFRLLLIFPMIFLIANGNSFHFAFFYLAARLLDSVDGYLARKYNWVSELGSKLDSYADIIIDVVGFSGFFLIKPELFTDNVWLWVIPFGMLFLSWFVSYVISKRLIILHLYTNKFFGLCFTSYLLLASVGYEIKTLLFLSAISGTAMALEQIAIFIKTRGNVNLETVSVFKIKT
ncbi:CDP-alcohol phosphatidyltransferase family protein [candidate division WWE3 bacterium]|jgi:phosphatidylglycerophosphate synthase|uniref:CDP-alcohol phosphatidyltransferase family protein n=1 Tax=candidate division WWE3 bacterium TaxID=2053526 RepID=A0A3A4ZK01_UNCKA|nr:MAG: CDP-alcohol phosphatidyltransferase family protein [candidate division WWE3 bacterium]